MPAVRDLVAEARTEGVSALETALFGPASPAEVDNVVVNFVRHVLGASVVSARFYRRGVGLVFGLDLDGGESVVVKVHRREVVGATLPAVLEVQAHAAAVGLPAPRPLAAPAPLGTGVATIEQLLDAGSEGNAHDPAVRRALARGLHDVVTAFRHLDRFVGLPVAYADLGAELWPAPHDLRFDFQRSAAGAEWIDDAARRALERIRGHAVELVLGHFDWRVENVRVEDGRVVAIYDWDSVKRAPEAVLVGAKAASFTASWTSTPTGEPLPTVEEMVGFVEDYETARETPFSCEEMALLDAANVYSLAYGARCEHSDAMLRPFGDHDVPERFRKLLRDRGEKLFA